MKRFKFVQIAGKLILMLVILIAAVGSYLFVRYPFAFQEIVTFAAMVNSPDILKPDPNITTIEQFDRFVTDQLNSRDIRGGAVAIVADGKVAWSQGYGYANWEDRKAATADTPFMIGSISKAVTGVAVMHAVEAGQLNLDADIQEYIDFEINNPNVGVETPVTMRHLATHTSGISDRDWVYVNSYENGDPTTQLEEFLQDYLAEDGENYHPNRNFLDGQPGETAEYSNIGAGVAGYAVGQATGMRLDVYARENIFEPLEMHNTGWFLSDFENQEDVAIPYAFMNRPHPHYGYPTWPEGQLRTSVNDLARLLAMVMNDGQLDGVQILQPETVNQMLAKQEFPGLLVESGEGIFWSYTNSGLIGHNGGDHGVVTAMYFNPETEVGVVILSNGGLDRGVGPVLTIARQILTSESTLSVIESIAR